MAAEAVAVSLELLVTKRRRALLLMLVMKMVMVMKQMVGLRKMWWGVRVRFFENRIVAGPARGLNHLRLQAGGVIKWVDVQVLLVPVASPYPSSVNSRSPWTSVGVGHAAAVRVSAAGVAALAWKLL